MGAPWSPLLHPFAMNLESREVLGLLAGVLWHRCQPNQDLWGDLDTRSPCPYPPLGSHARGPPRVDFSPANPPCCRASRSE